MLTAVYRFILAALWEMDRRGAAFPPADEQKARLLLGREKHFDGGSVTLS